MCLVIITLLLSRGLEEALGCRPGYGGGGEGTPPKEHFPGGGSNKSFFSDGNTWGGWSPPEGNDSWKRWLEIWGVPNNSRVDSTEEGRGPESGWPSYWKKLGLANRGVPPPPWALVAHGYGRPQYCFLQPKQGNCNHTMLRWGFNPTSNKCETFQYSGCGGNQNNFNNELDCVRACVEPPSTGCEDQAKVNFEEMIYVDD